MDVRQVRTAVFAAWVQVSGIAGRDPEQDVRGLALPVLDAVVSEARDHLHFDDPILHTLPDLISPVTVGEGEPLRASDAAIALYQLKLALDRAVENEGGS